MHLCVSHQVRFEHQPRLRSPCSHLRSLCGIGSDMDILAYTPAEVIRCRRTPGSFVAHILDTGKVLYERKEG